MFSIVTGESTGYYKFIRLRRFDKKRVVGVVSVYIVTMMGDFQKN